MDKAGIRKTTRRTTRKDNSHLHPEDLGFGELFERIRDAAIVADTETQQIVLWNSAATDIFGYSASEALDLRVEALVPEPLKSHFQARMTYLKMRGGAYIDSPKMPLEVPALKKARLVAAGAVSLREDLFWKVR
jgi:PAS domain-containing protein